MSKYVIDDSTLIAIADAVREKDGTSAPIKVSDLGERILAIPAGGGEGGYDIPDSAFNITDSCNYTFSGSTWNWFIEGYGNKITTSGIVSTNSMFRGSTKLKSVPFDINVSPTCKDMENMFYQSELQSLPLIKGVLASPTSNYSGTLNLEGMFSNCSKLREIPDDYFWNFGGDAFWAASENYYGDRNNMFQDCNSLRKLPDISMLKSTATTYGQLYYGFCQRCYSLDEAVNIPVNSKATLTSNAFSYFCNSASRVKAITFETNADGSPIAVNWKSQTIDLSGSYNTVGYAGSVGYIIGRNNGITMDKQVKDDATYQALKNDPDWFTADINYSRYNHDSAVATLNSLPDSSAYGANTIKFNGASGAKTDGGAINTLTEAEIAVAAAKGWTVTLA